MQKIRVGVFVCHCGNNIGAVVNVPELVEYSKGLPNVVYAEHNLYTCSADGLRSIKNKIEEYNLNRVVVASCTPRTHEPLFRSACEEAGLNRYLFEFVNIREQCSWIHRHIKEEATSKAKDLVKMGVAKACLLEPQEKLEIPVAPSSLVIGGGITGMTAALNLANQGFEIHLVEKEGALGGLARHLYKLFPTNADAEELVRQIIERVRTHKKIKIHMPAIVKDVSGFIGNFEVSVVEGSGETKFQVGTIVVATGAQELRPYRGYYGYGEMSNVLTQLELEKRLRRGINHVENVVMITCVGARIPERSYCSGFCCITAIKNGILLKETNPAVKVYVLYRELVAYGAEFEDYYRKGMEVGVRFIRYTLEKPPQIIGDGKAVGVRVYDELFGEEIELPCDMVVLTTPLVPCPENEQISRMLKVPLSEDKFFLEAHVKLRPVEFSTEGIYVCGSARWPTDIAGCISQAYAASSKAAIPMRKGFAAVEPITSLVNEDICAGCGNCVLVCPFNAVEVQPKDGKRVAKVTAVKCKGCGSCVAACPSGAMQQKGFTDQQVMGMIDALVGRGVF
jgi:heterodisulfide reductase subunit A